jgi:hypothetical protein
VPDCLRCSLQVQQRGIPRAKVPEHQQGNAMKKLIAVAALVVAGYAVPTIPAQAASSYPTNCLVLPLLQSECRDMIRENVSHATKGGTTMAAAKMTDMKHPKMPVAAWWTCEPAPAGTKAMYVCEY